MKKRSLALALALSLTAGFGIVQASPAENQAPPAMAQSGTMPAPPDGQLPPGPPPDGPMGGPGRQQTKSAADFTAAKVVDNTTASYDKLSLSAENTDENALLVRSGGKVTLTNSTLQKTGNSSSADASNFSGQNAVFLASNSTASLSNVTLTSDADGANAVFATGKNSVITADHLTIHTKNNSSRGLDATYDGTINATNVDITTEGAHCGALATDRGEGTVIVKNAKINTSGEGSPCIYSTGNIQLTDGTGEATGSEIAVVEGKNSIALQNADLTGHVGHGIMLYQSFSGDAGVGEASFSAKDSKLTNLSSGPMFYITNTTATASLENTQLVQDGDILVNVTSGRWGTAGKNGGNFTLNTANQKLTGKILANKISSVTLNLGDKASFRGSLNEDNAAKTASVNLKKGSSWELTADSYVTAITDENAKFRNIKSNGHNIYYDKNSNASLNGRTIKLPGGGRLIAK
ncbi:hypothetical protein [Mitsuokella sp. WILCCON 0060]|uniref:hypothetical protein n=1 Tax=Mitsuokella sp. WILCCON 0060 TaxID=3345341 RepID=UPI003F1B7EE8